MQDTGGEEIAEGGGIAGVEWFRCAHCPLPSSFSSIIILFWRKGGEDERKEEKEGKEKKASTVQRH